MPITSELPRLLSAIAVIGSYGALCAVIAWREYKRRITHAGYGARHAPFAAGTQPLTLVFASQTGFAEDIALGAAQQLRDAGVPADALPLEQLDAARLSASSRLLFVASTCGDGDAPDNAMTFVQRSMTGQTSLPHLEYGLLALGDRSYRHFCRFGRQLDNWLQQSGARPLFERIEVDRGDETALADWQHRLGHLSGSADLPTRSQPTLSSWQLVERAHLNPGSAGLPTYDLKLSPADGSPIHWEAGDLVQLTPPGDPTHPREYSIASIPAEGHLRLLVRQQQRADGSPGVASGWLTRELPPGEHIALRIRPHRNFRLGDNLTRPLILIGNGTGLAGLRAHLSARIAAGDHRNWLIFGERNACHDFYYRDEIEGWLAGDHIVRADFAFSRDQPDRIYVQDLILKGADTLRDWVADGAAIYVCGNAVGMASAVDQALGTVLGKDARDQLLAEGRYRRDVY